MLNYAGMNNRTPPGKKNENALITFYATVFFHQKILHRDTLNCVSPPNNKSRIVMSSFSTRIILQRKIMVATFSICFLKNAELLTQPMINFACPQQLKRYNTDRAFCFIESENVNIIITLTCVFYRYEYKKAAFKARELYMILTLCGTLKQHNFVF